MQSRIDCICLTFLHCVFSHVSSNRLSDRMQCHTGNICMIFFLCVFSNVSLICLPEGMHFHIRYICMTFLHCVVSSVHSMQFPARKHCPSQVVKKVLSLASTWDSFFTDRFCWTGQKLKVKIFLCLKSFLRIGRDDLHGWPCLRQLRWKAKAWVCFNSGDVFNHMYEQIFK